MGKRAASRLPYELSPPLLEHPLVFEIRAQLVTLLKCFVEWQEFSYHSPFVQISDALKILCLFLRPYLFRIICLHRNFNETGMVSLVRDQ